MSFRKASLCLINFDNLQTLHAPSDEEMFSQQFRLYDVWKDIVTRFNDRVEEQLKTYKGFIDALGKIHEENIQRRVYSSMLMLFDMSVRVSLPQKYNKRKLPETFILQPGHLELFKTSKNNEFSMDQGPPTIDDLLADPFVNKRKKYVPIHVPPIPIPPPEPKIDGPPIDIVVHTADLHIDEQRQTVRNCVSKPFESKNNMRFKDLLARKTPANVHIYVPTYEFIPPKMPVDFKERIESIDVLVCGSMHKMSRHLSAVPSQFIEMIGNSDGTVTQKIRTGVLGSTEHYVNKGVKKFYGTTDTKHLHEEFSLFGDPVVFQEIYNDFLIVYSKKIQENKEWLEKKKKEDDEKAAREKAKAK
jgi:hypothetical protein